MTPAAIHAIIHRPTLRTDSPSLFTSFPLFLPDLILFFWLIKFGALGGSVSEMAGDYEWPQNIHETFCQVSAA